MRMLDRWGEYHWALMAPLFQSGSRWSAVRLCAEHFVIDVHFAFNSRDGFVSVST